MVNSIDAALDEANYDPLLPADKIITLQSQVPDETDKKKKIDLQFKSVKPAIVGRQKSSDVMRQKPGLSSYSKNVTIPKEAFSLFITTDMLLLILSYTNTRVQETLDKCKELLERCDKYPHVRLVSETELEAFIGLMYFRGLYGLNNHSIDILFSNKYGLPVFGACMSRLRFKFILAHICFDDFKTRETRWQRDRFAALRELFEECNKNFAKILIPEDYLSLDETLYPMRNQVAFKQFNPDKPAKYGVLFKSINCARYPYTYQTHVYCGKPEGDPDENYVTGTLNYITTLVEKLLKFQKLDGRNISMDRLYTSKAQNNFQKSTGQNVRTFSF